jgi:DNA-binding transcriptional ArsR family regulator
MVAAANMVEVAALVGDTARATMLSALMGGQALTASELAARARIAKSTASGHLTKLVRARLLAVTQPQPLLPHRVAAGGQDAGKHQGRCCH